MWPQRGTRKESPNLESYKHDSREKAKREREREREPHGEAKPPNLLNIALLGLRLLACIFALLSFRFEVVPLLHACTCNKKENKKEADK